MCVEMSGCSLLTLKSSCRLVLAEGLLGGVSCVCGTVPLACCSVVVCLLAGV